MNNRIVLIICFAICIIAILFLIFKSLLPKLNQFLSNVKPWFVILLIVVISVIAIILGFALFGKAGSDSPFSKDVNGDSTGDAVVFVEVHQPGNGNNMGISLEELVETDTMGKKTLTIQIHGDNIIIQDKEVADINSLFEALNHYDMSAAEIVLVDNYSLTSVYRSIYSKIREMGIYPKETVLP